MPDNHHRVRFGVSMSPERYQSFYAGVLKNIVARTEEGKHVKFPASVLRPFLTHEGIQGYFEMEFDGNNKLVDIRLLGPLPRKTSE